MELPFFEGMLSQSQFLFEFAVLAALTAVVWERLGFGREQQTVA